MRGAVWVHDDCRSHPHRTEPHRTESPRTAPNHDEPNRGHPVTARRVTVAGRDRHGYITHLENPGEPWSPRSCSDVILDLELGQYSYFVQWPDRKTEVRDVEDSGGKYLRTDRDSSARNDLLDLPAA
jgi:hypothetical protein